MHQEIFSYCKFKHDYLGNSNMLDQESGNLNSRAKRVIAPKEYQNIFTELKYSWKAQRKILIAYLNEAQ